MTLNWATTNSNPAETKTKLLEVINNTHIPAFAKINWKDDMIVINIDQHGKSELLFSLASKDNQVMISEISRNISMLHRPFIPKLEQIVDSLLHKVGFNRI